MKEIEYMDEIADELVEKPERKIVAHFEKPIVESQVSKDVVVDEAFAIQYAEICQDIKDMEKLKASMNATMKAKRMAGEKNLQMGKALVIFGDVPATRGIDYKELWEAECGPVDAELSKKYTKELKKGYTTCEVKVL